MKVTFIYVKVTCKFIQLIHLADFLLVVILPILIVVIFIGNESTLNSWPEIIDRHVCNLPYTIISDFTFSFKLYSITGNLLAIYKGLKTVN